MRVLLFVFIFILSKYLYAENSNPAWVNNLDFNGSTWDATTTGGIVDSIIVLGEEVKFVLHTDRCIRNPDAVGKYPDDCDRGVIRSQLISKSSYSIDSHIEYNFRIKDDGVLGKPWVNSSGTKIFEIKPHLAVPSFAINFNTHTRELSSELTFECNVGSGDRDQYTKICPSVINYGFAKLKSGWNDFKIQTKVTTETDGYVLIYFNNKLVYKYKGQTTYPHDRPLGYWFGTYTCCGATPVNEPTRSYFFRDVSSKLLKKIEIKKIYSILEKIHGSASISPLIKDKKWLKRKLQFSNLQNSYGIIPNIGFSLFVNFWDGTPDNPNDIQIFIRNNSLPSIDFNKMKNKCGNKFVKMKGDFSEIRLSFLSKGNKRGSRCIYDLLSLQDREIIQAIINNLEEIMNMAIKENNNGGYWKDVSRKIIQNSRYLNSS